MRAGRAAGGGFGGGEGALETVWRMCHSFVWHARRLRGACVRVCACVCLVRVMGGASFLCAYFLARVCGVCARMFTRAACSEMDTVRIT